MKRAFLLTLALMLIATLVSGCSLLPLLLTASQSKNRDNAADKEAEYESFVLDDGDMAAEEAMLNTWDGYLAPTSLPMGYAPAMMAQDFNTEEYASVVENGFQDALTNPLSTFSADVDTASYCNLRRMLNDGYTASDIPSGAVRIEEMLNYFRYDYASPTGDDRFAVTAQLSACPWNTDNLLLMLGIKAQEAPERADEGSNLVFLVDVSGSMADINKLDLVKRALTMLTDALTEKDTVSIVTYASGEQIIIDGANPAKDRLALLSAIDSLEAGGSTNGERGLAQAYEVAQRHFRRGGNNRVIMCSDGDLNVGITSQSDLHDFVSEKKETGVYLSVLGFGAGNYKDTKMETLADDGNGSYYYIDSMLEARKVLVEELTQTLYTVADDVKFQIEFNPAKVAAYRQVGYENRQMDDRDFENDAKDAGEVGAGACVTVLYELVPAGAADGENSLKYQTSTLTEAAQGGEWLTVSMRSKAPGAQQSELQTAVVDDSMLTDAPSGDFLFAAAVAEFGMILKDSENRGSATYETVLELLKQAPLSDEYREEFFSLVKIVQRSDRLSD